MLPAALIQRGVFLYPQRLNHNGIAVLNSLWRGNPELRVYLDPESNTRLATLQQDFRAAHAAGTEVAFLVNRLPTITAVAEAVIATRALTGEEGLASNVQPVLSAEARQLIATMSTDRHRLQAIPGGPRIVLPETVNSIAASQELEQNSGETLSQEEEESLSQQLSTLSSTDARGRPTRDPRVAPNQSNWTAAGQSAQQASASYQRVQQQLREPPFAGQRGIWTQQPGTIPEPWIEGPTGAWQQQPPSDVTAAQLPQCFWPRAPIRESGLAWPPAQGLCSNGHEQQQLRGRHESALSQLLSLVDECRRAGSSGTISYKWAFVFLSRWWTRRWRSNGSGPAEQRPWIDPRTAWQVPQHGIPIPFLPTAGPPLTAY